MPRGGGMGALRHGATLGGVLTPEYSVWLNMNTRCRNPNHVKYEYYGGRGIIVCTRWRSFELFLADIGKRPTKKHQLDRFPNRDGNYEPGNVRWTTQKQQKLNRDCTLWVVLKGRKIAVKQACKKTGIPYNAARKRLNRGWTPIMAVTVPLSMAGGSRKR